MTTPRGRASDQVEFDQGEGGATGVDEFGRIDRILDRMRPDEGWVAVPLVLLLTGTMAWSVADARWILGQDGLTSFLIWISLAAALWGYLSARLDLSPWLAQALGCTIGAFVVIEAVGASLPDAGWGPGGWFHAAAASVTEAYLDLTWRHQASTLQVGHFCLVLGIVVWGTAQAASYDVFGYRRAVNGVLLLAVVLIANMALTPNDQFAVLVVFSAAALVLLLLSHAADERSSWLRHRIWRGRDFESPHLQGGLTFASLAVAASLALTFAASSAPLATAMNGLGSDVQSALSWMSGYLPNGGVSRIEVESDFGPSMTISSVFHESNHEVFTVHDPSDQISFHWRLLAYDSFQSNGWAIGAGAHQDQVIAGGTLDAGTLDFVGAQAPGRLQVSITVHLQDPSITHLVTANEPDSVNAGVQRTLVGSDPSGTNLAGLTTDATDYTVLVDVPDLNPDGTGLTEWQLRHVGAAFPPVLRDRYTQGVDQVGTDGRSLLGEIKSWAQKNGNGFKTEYDVAKAIQSYLQDPQHFTYNTDVSSLMPKCAGLSTVDCFARIRQGFCEQYATTMTMLMRLDGYPARYVQGYRQGTLDPDSLVEQVTSQQSHAWVEVYFPTYGWIPFDPTGGGVGEQTLLPAGSAPLATPTPGQSVGPDESTGVATPAPSSPPVTNGGSTALDYAPPALLVAGILSGSLALALFVLWRRRSRRPEGPDAVYRDVVRLASRLGHRPQPTQTVYEYTGMLSDVVPQARGSLGVVAAATVDVRYGKRQLSSERLAFLAAAHQIVRKSLLRLAFRVPWRRGNGGGASGSVDRRGRSGRSGRSGPSGRVRG
jgi:hypothetical protein